MLQWGAFCNTFDLHYAIIGLENQCLVFFLSGRLRQVNYFNTLVHEFVNTHVSVHEIPALIPSASSESSCESAHIYVYAETRQRLCYSHTQSMDVEINVQTKIHL